VPRAAPKQTGRRAGPGPGQLAERAGGITDGRQAMLRPAGRGTWPLKTCPAPAETDGRTGLWGVGDPHYCQWSVGPPGTRRCSSCTSSGWRLDTEGSVCGWALGHCLQLEIESWSG
jgi:hypothetical protein